MTTEEIAKVSAAVLGWLTAIVGWSVGLVQWRKKRKAEAELRLIRCRGETFYTGADAICGIINSTSSRKLVASSLTR